MYYVVQLLHGAPPLCEFSFLIRSVTGRQGFTHQLGFPFTSERIDKINIFSSNSKLPLAQVY